MLDTCYLSLDNRLVIMYFTYDSVEITLHQSRMCFASMTDTLTWTGVCCFVWLFFKVASGVVFCFIL